MFTRLIDEAKIVNGAAPAALTSTAGDGDYVSMKGYERLTVILSVLNGNTVTGGTITLKQATNVSGSGEKALAFTKVYANVDTAAAEALTETTVVSNTFTTDTTNAKALLYVMEIQSADLDINNAFDCVRIDSTGMANAVGSVLYILRGQRFTPLTNVTSN